METTTRQFIIGMILLGAIITGCFSMIAYFVPTDSIDLKATNETLNKFTDIKTNADSMSNTVQNTKANTGVLGIINGLVEISVTALSSIWTSFTTFTLILNSLGTSIGIPIPIWFSGALISIVAIIIAFSLMAAWFKWWL